jgi:nucleotide-binding universal stress UspA family protein
VKAFNSIAVGFDGSIESESAVRWAARVARQFDASLTVLHAAGILERLGTSFSDAQVPPVITTIFSEEGLDSARCRWVVDEGDACSALLHCSSPPINAELLVVGSRGHGKRPGMMIGSVSLEIVQHASVPVVVVPGRAPN